MRSTARSGKITYEGGIKGNAEREGEGAKKWGEKKTQFEEKGKRGRSVT